MAALAPDRNLLFGLLALQNGLINQGQLVAAFQAWTLEKARALADHLVGRGDLDADDPSAVEALVPRHLKKDGGDAEKSLAAIPTGRSTRAKLAGLCDPQIDASLAHVAAGSAPTEPDADPDRTASYSVGAATSDGQRGELAECAYAAEDALIEMLFEKPELHAKWRRLPPDDPGTLPRIGRELTGTVAVAQTHLQALRRVLFQAETVGADRFALYELYREIRSVRRALEERARPAGQPPRRPTVWESVSATVTAARSGDNVPALTGLLAAYEKLTTGLSDGAPSAVAPLADQLYRLSTSLCVDGCCACLHRSSGLMSDGQTNAAVSRDLLQRYREFVSEPLTLFVRRDLPDEAAVQKILTEQGICRILVAPTQYDAIAAELVRRGFEGRGFDPLLRAVVCIRSSG
jgi:hypothetical protein